MNAAITKKSLIDKLSALEIDVENLRIDMKSLERKMELSNSYEDELANRIILAKQATEDVKEEYFKKSGDLSTKYEKMKQVLDIYTGNHFRS